MNSKPDPLAPLGLLNFQERTARYAAQRLLNDGHPRFLVADEVGLGKTKVAQGVIAMALARRSGNVVYIAPSMAITRQNLPRLQVAGLQALSVRSLCLEARAPLTSRPGARLLLGLTPTRDLHANHPGTYAERALILRLLETRWHRLRTDPKIQVFFSGGAVGPRRFEDAKPQVIPRSLRDHVLDHTDADLLSLILDGKELKSRRREIIGGLRAVLATYALRRLAPSLVIVDEFQRCTREFLTDTPTPQIEYISGRRLLGLSATPYDPGSMRRDSTTQQRDAFHRLVEFLNPHSSVPATTIDAAMTELGAALERAQIDRSHIESLVRRLGDAQRAFMVRTERPRQAQVNRRQVISNLAPDDVAALKTTLGLLNRAAETLGRPARLAEMVELWKSVPYTLSTLDGRYHSGRALNSVTTPGTLRAPAALTKTQLDRGTSLSAPAHARLRALLEEMGDDASPRLWLPPTVPYVAQAGAGRASKTLIFTSWAAAPPAIAASVNLVVEPRGRRPAKSRLELHSNRRPVRSTYLLAAPLPKLAAVSGCDPAVIRDAASGPLTSDKAVSSAVHALRSARLLRRGGRRLGDRSLVDRVIELNMVRDWPRAQRLPGSWAPEVTRDGAVAESIAVSPEHARLVAELAVAAPGTCAYRALRRLLPELTEQELRSRALEIGYLITRLLGSPAAIPVVSLKLPGTKAPYWRKALRYCLDHDVQSMLEEYLFLLIQDHPRLSPLRQADAAIESLAEALRTAGRLVVARSPGSPRSPSTHGTVQFARALGEREADHDEARAGGRRRRGGSPLLTAFNSPFPPFVLATTSTGQEGLDLHRYCRRVVHWNLPSSPQAMEQREGRVDRYLSLGVRTAISDAHHVRAAADGAWASLLEAAQASGDVSSDLAPLWHYGSTPRIDALATIIPFSREEGAWQQLLEAASWYRLVLGQPDPQRLLERLANASVENREALHGLAVDLRPPQ